MSGDKSVVPTVSFRVIKDNPYAAERNELSQTIRSFGYNSVDESMERPEHYIRYIEPIESELAKQVEYDMDEQDREWLEAVNDERTKQQLDKVSYELFEIIMDRLEKEWFDLMKRVPTPASMLPVEDSKCAICDDGEGENANAIVFCDGCNLAVHQDCYGVPYIPEGQWLCRKCTVSPENPVDCILCPGEAGAFKQTTYPSAQWAHLLCAIWIPEVGVGNQVYMEPIEGIENIPKSRWKLFCSICKIRTGACIQCDNRSCFTAFHVTCARSQGLLSSMKSLGNDGVLRAFCNRHLPPERKAELALQEEYDEEVSDAASPGTVRPRSRKKSRKTIQAEEGDDDFVPSTPPGRGAATSQSKSARAHAKVYSSGPPLVPAIIVKNITEYVRKVPARKKMPLIERICRYWSLKREARRGAPLLKRLHLEPWTAAHGSQQESDAEKAKKMQYLVLIRNDLERVRMLAELVRKREKEKLRQAQVIKDFLDDIVFPYDAQMRLVLEKITSMDRSELFLNPVSRVDVPDYFDVIKEPMSWSEIDAKLEGHLYETAEDLARDVRLVVDNAMTYNPKDNPYHRLAGRIKTAATPLLDDLMASIAARQNAPTGSEESLRTGLQPSNEVLSVLQPPDNENGIDLLGDLFTFKLDPPREPTPPPPPKKQRPVLSAQEINARKEARKARFAEPRPTPTRATRATHKLDDDVKAESLKSGEVNSETETSKTAISARRRTRSGLETSADAGSSREGSLVAPKRPQKGVAGLAPYSPLTPEERNRREHNLAIQVEAVDDKENFQRFNVGWVLPEGTKRGGRSNGPPPALKPRKASVRKGKADKETDAPAAAEQQPDAKRPRSPSDSPLSDLMDDEGMLSPIAVASQSIETDGAAAPASAQSGPSASETKGRRSGQKRKAAGEPLERLSPAKKAKTPKRSRTTPTTTDDNNEDVKPVRASRAPQSRRAKVAEESLTAAASPAALDAAAVDSVVEVAADQSVDVEAQIKAAVEDDDPTRMERLRELSGRNNANGKEVEGDLYPFGTLVWAKTPGFCFFPGEIADAWDDYYDIPESVWKNKPVGDEPMWLVQFFDRSRSYSWCPASRLDLLGENDAIDQNYLAGRDKNKSGHFKSSQMRQACRKAYRDAMYQMDVGEEVEADD